MATKKVKTEEVEVKEETIDTEAPIVEDKKSEKSSSQSGKESGERSEKARSGKTR